MDTIIDNQRGPKRNYISIRYYDAHIDRLIKVKNQHDYNFFYY